MIEEAYVSFETAKLLKEKGFNEPCFSYYLTTKTLHTSFHNRVHVEDEPHFNCLNIENAYDIKDKSLFEDICSAPTLQMAMKWLREVHNIFITIEIKGDPRKEDFIYYKWSVAKYCNIKIDRIDNNLTCPEDYWIAPYEEEETYERTCEAAIKYCLENLI